MGIFTVASDIAVVVAIIDGFGILIIIIVYSLQA
jgi:hypothetical protein